MMNFAESSPEVISGRLYAGAGPGPLTAAATAWDQIAAQWSSATESYQAVISELTAGSWRGPAAESMAAAAQEHVAWMQSVAQNAEQTANQVRSAVAAYQRAFAAVVPPSAVAANRAALASLMAGNVFGQNSALIAANQAQYEQMSAQDIAAMYDYAAASATATELPGFPAAPQTTNPPVASSTRSAPAAATPSNPLLNFLNSDPVQAFETLYSGTTNLFQSVGLSTLLPAGVNLDAGMGIQAAIYGSQAFAGATGLQPAFSGIASSVYPFSVFPASVSEGAAGLALTSSPGSAVATAPEVSASLARATPIGGLSAPPSWRTTSAGLRLAATALAQGSLPGFTGSSAPELAALSGLPVGIPPMVGVVNASTSGRPTVGLKSDFTVIPRLAREAAADPHLSAPGGGAPDLACASPDGEGSEIAELRKLVAELAERRAAATQLIRNAIDG